MSALRAPLKMTRGIGAVQVFRLGAKYSQSLGATFLDADGTTWQADRSTKTWSQAQ